MEDFRLRGRLREGPKLSVQPRLCGARQPLGSRYSRFVALDLGPRTYRSDSAKLLFESFFGLPFGLWRLPLPFLCEQLAGIDGFCGPAPECQPFPKSSSALSKVPSRLRLLCGLRRSVPEARRETRGLSPCLAFDDGNYAYSEASDHELKVSLKRTETSKRG